MAAGVRWNSVRLEKKLTDALAVASGNDLDQEYNDAAAQVARETSGRIRESGRGGSHNSEFANIQHRVYRSGAGRVEVRVGWLNPGADAAERGGGGKLWYQYQDRGFHLFGGPNWIEGVGATIDQRYRLVDALQEVNVRFIDRLAKILDS